MLDLRLIKDKYKIYINAMNLIKATFVVAFLTFALLWLAKFATVKNSTDVLTSESGVEVVTSESNLVDPELEACNDFSNLDLAAHLPHEEMLMTHYNRAVADISVSGIHAANFNLENLRHYPQAILGYVERTSISKTDALEVFFAKGIAGSGNYISSILIFDASSELAERQLVLNEREFLLNYHTCFSYRHDGCRFSDSIELDVSDLDPGGYYIYLIDDNGSSSSPIFFNLRATDENLAQQDLFVLLSDTTWHAYNAFGGGSLYEIHEGYNDGTLSITQNFDTRLYSVGFGRPLSNFFRFSIHNRDLFSQRSSQAILTPREVLNHCVASSNTDRRKRHQCFYNTRPTPLSNMAFSWILQEQGVDFDILSMDDLLLYAPELLSENSTIIITGHNEYWTPEMRMGLLKYIERGGNVLNMSGNVDWWQINIDGQTMYQDQGGLYRSETCNSTLPEQYLNSGQTGYFIDPATEAIFGVSYRYGGYSLSYSIDHGLIDDVEAHYEQEMTILDASHPLFRGLDIDENNTLHVGPLFMADEVDGMPLLNDELNRNFRFDASPTVRPLAKMVIFAANHISGENGAYLRGLVEPAVIVEHQPFASEEAGRVLSISAIGPAYALLEKDGQAIRFLMNGIAYLNKPNNELTNLH